MTVRDRHAEAIRRNVRWRRRETTVEPITPGMSVRSLDGRTVGTVISKRSCCFSFETKDGMNAVSVRADGIFDVQFGEVTLIYVAGPGHKYLCGMHPAVNAVEYKQRATWPPPQKVGRRR